MVNRVKISRVRARRRDQTVFLGRKYTGTHGGYNHGRIHMWPGNVYKFELAYVESDGGHENLAIGYVRVVCRCR